MNKEKMNENKMNTKRMNEKRMNVKKMVTMGILSALGIVLMLIVRFPIIPAASYLEYDAADVAVLIGAFMYGPVAGLIIAVVVSVVQALTVSAQGGWVGLVMHLIATGTLVMVAGLIYKRFHTFKGAIAALMFGSLSMTLIMIPANLIFTPIYGVPYDVVVDSIWPIVIPFNLIKAYGNSIIVMLIYKPISRALRSIGPNPVKL